MNRVWWIRRLLIVVLATGFSGWGQATERFHTTALGNVAVGGYDPVAYFTEEKAVKGLRKFSWKWEGANWRFSKKKHLALFKETPEKYAPKYGGYCAWAVSAKKMFYRGNPRSWKIVDGSLYLNHNKTVEDRWLEDIPGHIQKADSVWDEFREDH